MAFSCSALTKSSSLGLPTAYNKHTEMALPMKSSLRLPPSYTRFPTAAYRRRPVPFGSAIHHHTDDDEDDDAYYSDSDSDIHPVSQGDGEEPPQGIDFKLDIDAARIRVEIPGVDKHTLKLWFDKHAFNFQGITEDKEFEIDSICEGAVEMPAGLLEVLNVEETRVDLENGVMKVVIPKLQLEERDDVFIVDLSSA